MKLLLWLCVLILIVMVQYTVKETFSVRDGVLKIKKYEYLPLDIYPYDALPIITATSLNDTFTVKASNDVLVDNRSTQSAKIYTACVIKNGIVTLEDLKQKYTLFMGNAGSVLKIKEYNATSPILNMIQANTLNTQFYKDGAIRDPADYMKFIQFTGVTNALVRAWIAEMLERALLNTTSKGVYVSVLIYNDIPDTIDTTFPPYYYIQRILNFPYLT